MPNQCLGGFIITLHDIEKRYAEGAILFVRWRPENNGGGGNGVGWESRRRLPTF
jgi:hypothetical protein